MLPLAQAATRQGLRAGQRVAQRARSVAPLSTQPKSVPNTLVSQNLERLRSKELLREAAFVRGQWVKAASSFTVNGKFLGHAEKDHDYPSSSNGSREGTREWSSPLISSTHPVAHE